MVDNESRAGTTVASETVVDEITQASESEPIPPVERVVERETGRPSLESVWESLQEKGSLSSSTSEPELPKAVLEMEVPRVRPSSLRTRPRTGAKRNVTFKDDFEKGEEMEVRKRHPADRRTKVPPGCLGLFLSVVLASLVVYIASPNVPTKPVSAPPGWAFIWFSQGSLRLLALNRRGGSFALTEATLREFP